MKNKRDIVYATTNNKFQAFATRYFLRDQFLKIKKDTETFVNLYEILYFMRMHQRSAMNRFFTTHKHS